MNNYQYIIASLPVLSPGGEDRSFDYEKVKEQICSQLSKSDNSLLAFFERGLDDNSLSEELYTQARQSKSRFTRLYFALDLAIRNRKVALLAGKLFSSEQAKEKIAQYSIHPPVNEYGEYREPKESHIILQPSDAQLLDSIFTNSDIVEKEKRLDEFRWDKINSFTSLDYFNIDVILAFLAKGKLVQRWNILDKEKGKELFKRLVDEVRGTYDKSKLSYTSDENKG